MKNLQPPTSNIQPSTATHSSPRWVFNVKCWAVNVPRSLLIFAIRVYRWTISPMQVFLFGPTGGCRFTPSCSQYALDAVRAHGALAGGLLAAKRICRCHPWGGCGHDPAPGTTPDGRRQAESGIVLENAH